MRIGIGADHAAFSMKNALAESLRARGHEVVDLGPQTPDRVDYPDYAARVAAAVASGRCERGVLVCGTGIGMSIAANKVPGIRAALVHDPFTARLAAEHNHANVLCFGARVHALEYALELVSAWLATPFEPRHQPRLDKIGALEAAARGKGPR
jgi:ribose 5-phosphate isomerase B